jgi:putative metallohydrolase (TIGR04338 family)
LYNAEHFVNLPNDTNLVDIKSVEKFVAKVLSSRWLIKKYPKLAVADIAVKDGRGRRKACGGLHSISLPAGWARHKLVILHEQSHSFCDRIYGRNGIAGHGWEFAAMLLDLVRHFLGKEDYLLLKRSFKEHRVRLRPKKERDPNKPKRVMPPAAIEALKKYREQRRIAKRQEAVDAAVDFVKEIQNA